MVRTEYAAADCALDEQMRPDPFCGAEPFGDHAGFNDAPAGSSRSSVAARGALEWRTIVDVYALSSLVAEFAPARSGADKFCCEREVSVGNSRWPNLAPPANQRPDARRPRAFDRGLQYRNHVGTSCGSRWLIFHSSGPLSEVNRPLPQAVLTEQ